MKCLVFITSISYLDDILPLMFELKKANLISSIVFITTKKKWYDYMIQNVVLYDGIKTLGGRLTCLDKHKNSYLNILYQIFVLRKLFYSKVLTIETKSGIAKSRLLSIVLGYNRKRWKGQRILSLIRNLPFKSSVNVSNYYWSILGKPDIKEVTVKGYDAVLLTHTREQYEEIRNIKFITDARFIQIGYTRELNEWKQFIGKNFNNYFKGEIEMPYFFFPLDVVGTWIGGEKCVSADVKLAECLAALKEYNSDILTVFKPHHKTDIKKLQEILDSIGYENYVISYLHPLILMKNAKFTLACSPTSLLVGAHLNGCTTIEYADYDARYNRYSDEKSIHLGCVDYFVHRDREYLKQVVKELIYNDNSVIKRTEDIEEYMPVFAPPEIINKFNWL